MNSHSSWPIACPIEGCQELIEGEAHLQIHMIDHQGEEDSDDDGSFKIIATKGGSPEPYHF